MVITIREAMAHEPDYIYIESRSEEFKKTWGNGLRASRSMLFNYMRELSDWANNELGEECLFERVLPL